MWVVLGGMWEVSVRQMDEVWYEDGGNRGRLGWRSAGEDGRMHMVMLRKFVSWTHGGRL